MAKDNSFEEVCRAAHTDWLRLIEWGKRAPLFPKGHGALLVPYDELTDKAKDQYYGRRMRCAFAVVERAGYRITRSGECAAPPSLSIRELAGRFHNSVAGTPRIPGTTPYCLWWGVKTRILWADLPYYEEIKALNLTAALKRSVEQAGCIFVKEHMNWGRRCVHSLLRRVGSSPLKKILDKISKAK